MQTVPATPVQSLELVEQPARALAAHHANAPAVITPMDLLQMAMTKGADLDQLERLMVMKREYEADEARKAYFADLASFKAEAIEIIKRKRVRFENSKGGFTDYKHAELSDVVEAVGPALSKHGFSWSWSVKQSKDWIEVTCTLKHRLGHTESVTMGGPPDQSGGKNSIQAVISTTTYLERHTLKAITGVSEEGDDNDGRSSGGQDGAPEQAAAGSLIDDGNQAALGGTKALTDWFGGLSGKQRNALGREYLSMKRRAAEADAGGAGQ